MPWYLERRRQTIQQYATTGKIVGVARANTSLNVTKHSHGDKMGYARYADLLFSTAKICMCIITAIAHATAVTHSITYGSYTFCAINKYTHAMQRDLLEPCAGQLARTVLRGGDRSDAVSLPDLAHKIREAMASEVKSLRLGGAGRHVEVDGCYVGGHVRPANRKEDRKDRRLAENRSGRRQVVVVIRERALSGTSLGGTLPAVFESEDAAAGFIRARVDRASTVHADESSAWNALHARFDTRRINHSVEYATDEACTNQAESYFSRLRRGEMGHHHRISGVYLVRYAREASWKEDHRRDSNGLQLRAVLVLVTRTGPSVDFCGYWQRSRQAA
jgi:hypothetical protein